tara:strand:- start:10823 stop:11596 length:774 start_codon:yes stop_codon:yes gene_type:complete
MKIKFLSGWTDIGGSTIAFIRLVNLLNENGFDATLYGNSEYPNGRCKYKLFTELVFKPTDVLVHHFTKLDKNPGVRKVILSCHETNLFPIKEIKPFYDKVHFVSEFQKNWHEVDGVVIPNVLPNLINRKCRRTGVAGIVGSIDPHKQIHKSVERALNDPNVSRVEIYGKISDPDYFNNKVLPLLSNNVVYCGIAYNLQKMYDELDVVYHSSLRETFNYIKTECALTGVRYEGLPENDPKAEYWDNEKILEAWKTLLQ